MEVLKEEIDSAALIEKKMWLRLRLVGYFIGKLAKLKIKYLKIHKV